jgi:CRP-like cAMP-binding protein
MAAMIWRMGLSSRYWTALDLRRQASFEYDFDHNSQVSMPSDLFESLPADAIARRSFAPGEAVFRQGDPTRGLFTLVSGAVTLLRRTEAGAEIVIHRARPGETFAEASLFSDAYHCDAVAAAPTSLIALDRRWILHRFRTDPDFAIALARRFAAQVQTYRRKLELLAINHADERVFAALADGMLTSGVKPFAAEIGLTHEAVYRALASLTRAGRTVKTGRGRYRIARGG